jgi:hypothetical protein
MMNLFVPLPIPVMGPPVRGLHFKSGGEIQKDFAAKYAKAGGTILVGACAQGCLCGFIDWDAVYELSNDLFEHNAITTLSLLRFWSKSRYELTERVLDPDDPELRVPFEYGEVVVLQTLPADRRRHRRLLRALTARVGSQATLHMKHGETVHGGLTSFDPESEVGTIGDRTFVAAQVLSLDPLVE